jgi:hypothetical protein
VTSNGGVKGGRNSRRGPGKPKNRPHDKMSPLIGPAVIRDEVSSDYRKKYYL